MSQFGAWLSTLAQQALAILIGGVIAVGWGREITERIGKAVEDRRPQLIAYIDVPQEGNSPAFYYIGSSAGLQQSPVKDGMYHTRREVSDQYSRYEFEPEHRIHSKKKLCFFLMTALLAQDGGHILQDHSLHPSQNSWQPGKPFGKFPLLKAAKIPE
jgi:hypothetical protein